MYDYFYLFGPKNLPFVTNFCIGSGKHDYRMGREVRKNWFNLKLQGIQPSTPSREGFFSHYYADAFDGGSSLSLDTTELIRIFVCELSCADDIIFSYTFKRQSKMNHVQMKLNVYNEERNIDNQIVCDAGEHQTNPYEIPCLIEDDVRDVAVFLANNGKTFVPSRINGWETRYYLLKFDEPASTIITDIGFKKGNNGQVLLGQIACYSAKELRNGFRHIKIVKL